MRFWEKVLFELNDQRNYNHPQSYILEKGHLIFDRCVIDLLFLQCPCYTLPTRTCCWLILFTTLCATSLAEPQVSANKKSLCLQPAGLTHICLFTNGSAGGGFASAFCWLIFCAFIFIFHFQLAQFEIQALCQPAMHQSD